ncbi:two-component system, OmpR family, phosphate regulon sensor histidine kinase PhoR [Flavobacterium akiainvivens]|nr:two-component system, OmpR family, phosphate regulon sensor histidine kinase PhoR [Flavobacterium akiainvivens]
MFFMSLSLLGIILVQLYWVNSSLKNSEEQFRFHVKEVLARVAYKLEQREIEAFFKVYDDYKRKNDKLPTRKELLPFYDRYNAGDKETVIYSDQVTRDYDEVFFEKDKINNLVRKEVPKDEPVPTKSITSLSVADDADRAMMFKLVGYLQDYRDNNYIENWITKEQLQKDIAAELTLNGVDTHFEFGIFNKDNPTRLRSSGLKQDPTIILRPILEFKEDTSPYMLAVSFPEKERFLFSSILGITSLSLVFTLIIIIAYLSAINQLVKQKQISEIKTDFINNMTHEFKTPIATINLALDAIKNPRIYEDPEKVQRYLAMIREENKRMHSQVENVLQISKLDRRELDIEKDATDVHDIIDVAVEHVGLIIEARQGTLTTHLDARRTTALLNDVHFTNVLVNILDNAIKYSPDEPVIQVYTENVKDFILIKVRDHGLGMNKQTQKKIFEKFYREHTGDIHNVKGHGLGLAYVKRIIEDHNCHIYVESEKGKGSTFIIKMPLIN